MQNLIFESDFNKARKKIRESTGEIIFSSNDDEFNMKILEKENIHVLLINQAGRKDFQKQRNSGFNQVLAKIAKKKNVVIGINFDEILSSTPKKQAEVLARIKQNIKICNKNKIKMKFIPLSKSSERNVYDLRALGLVLGMPTWMASAL